MDTLEVHLQLFWKIFEIPTFKGNFLFSNKCATLFTKCQVKYFKSFFKNTFAWELQD